MDESPYGPYGEPKGEFYDYGPDEFLADRWIGILMMALFAMLAIAGLTNLLYSGATAVGGPASTKPLALGWLIAGIVALLASVLGLGVGYGIMNSRRWGFVCGIFVFSAGALGQAFGFSHASDVVGILVFLAAIVFCALRLNGTLGNKPGPQ